MLRSARPFLALFAGLAALLPSSAVPQPAPGTPNLIRERGPLTAIEHVLVIDGTGAAPRANQTILIDHGRIIAIGPDGSIAIPQGASRIDGRGRTAIPGLVGMHQHMFRTSSGEGPFSVIQAPFTFPQLYLASGVTTARTAGSVDPHGDLGIKREIEAGRLVGPDLDLTAPYLEGAPPAIMQLYPLRGPAEARAAVRHWASLGFTSIKAYMNISPAELAAAIREAHRRGMRVTGHLCSVGFEEAARLGIDNLEHGPFAAPDGGLDPRRAAGRCGRDGAEAALGAGAVVRHVIQNVAVDSPEVRRMIRTLVARRVAITSTLAVLEGGDRPDLEAIPHLRALFPPDIWAIQLGRNAAMRPAAAFFAMMLRKEMAFERAFAAAGGLLMAGADPTGDGHVLAGLGDQRNIELLYEAGFTVPQAIRIATLNGAIFLRRADRIGSLEAGKRADIVLLDGDLMRDIRAITRPVIVFKNGIGYDSQAIYASLRGQVGLH
ncbi:MAG TPA: amidohydrolase family protein [Allosphingosinicella sp.]|nr:amidohydrolase family protein [Allosphingosinicella sp.]